MGNKSSKKQRNWVDLFKLASEDKTSKALSLLKENYFGGGTVHLSNLGDEAFQKLLNIYQKHSFKHQVRRLNWEGDSLVTDEGYIGLSKFISEKKDH